MRTLWEVVLVFRGKAGHERWLVEAETLAHALHIVEYDCVPADIGGYRITSAGEAHYDNVLLGA